MTTTIERWRDWLQQFTDRLLAADDLAEAGASATEQRLLATLYLARKALISRIEAIEVADDDARPALAAQPVVDDDGTVVGADLATAATEVDSALAAIEQRLTERQRATMATAELAAAIAVDLRAAERLADELGSEANVVAALRDRVNRGEVLADMGAQATAVRRRLEAVDRERRAALDGLAGAPATLVSLEAREQQVRDIAERCRDKILGAPMLAVPSVAALGAPPDAAGPWSACRARVMDYLDRVQRLGAAFDEAERRFTEPLTRRDELRGLLQAYRDKAASAGRAESPDTEPVYRAAADLLWHSPCDLPAAAAAVQRYIDTVNHVAQEPAR